MYTHVVLFQLKDPANVERAIALFRSMEGRIPVLKHLEVAADDVHSDYSADLVLVCKFDRAEDVQVYFDHPFHQGILKETGPLVRAKMKVDFWERP
jgi:hypothetical protein